MISLTLLARLQTQQAELIAQNTKLTSENESNQIRCEKLSAKVEILTGKLQVRDEEIATQISKSAKMKGEDKKNLNEKDNLILDLQQQIQQLKIKSDEFKERYLRLYYIGFIDQN